MFTSLTSYNPQFARLSKYNPEACEIFDLGVFYHISQFWDFVLPISSPAQVKGQFCPCLIPFISSLHHLRVGPKVGVVFNLGLAPEMAARGSFGSRRRLPCLACRCCSRPVARAEVGPASMAMASPAKPSRTAARPTMELELRPAEHQLAQAAHPASPSLTSCSLTLDGETPSSPMGAATGETLATLWAAARILSRATRAAPRNQPLLLPGIATLAMGETGAGAVRRRRPTPAVLTDGGWLHGAEAPALVQGIFKTWLGLSFKGAGESEVEDDPKRRFHTSGWSER
jgi:hypothetical protein